MKKIIFFLGILLILPMLLAYNITVIDNCSIQNDLIINNGTLEGNVSLICFNKTIEINSTTFYNYTNYTNITYYNQTIINVTNGSVYNLTNNITQNYTNYIWNGTGLNQSLVYNKTEIDNVLSTYAKLNQIPSITLPENWTNMTADIQKLKDESDNFYIWKIVIAFGVLFALIALALAIKQAVAG